MSEKITTSQLEQVLLNKELKKIQAKVQEGLNVIASAFNSYVNIGDYKERNAMLTYLKDLHLISYSYIGGGYKLASASPIPVPKDVQTLILRHVVKDFLERIDVLDDITDDLQNLINT